MSSPSHPFPRHYFNARSSWQRCFQEVSPQSPPGTNPNGTLIPKQDLTKKVDLKSAKTKQVDLRVHRPDINPLWVR